MLVKSSKSLHGASASAAGFSLLPTAGNATSGAPKPFIPTVTAAVFVPGQPPGGGNMMGDGGGGDDDQQHPHGTAAPSASRGGPAESTASVSSPAPALHSSLSSGPEPPMAFVPPVIASTASTTDVFHPHTGGGGDGGHNMGMGIMEEVGQGGDVGAVGGSGHDHDDEVQGDWDGAAAPLPQHHDTPMEDTPQHNDQQHGNHHQQQDNSQQQQQQEVVSGASDAWTDEDAQWASYFADLQQWGVYYRTNEGYTEEQVAAFYASSGGYTEQQVIEYVEYYATKRTHAVAGGAGAGVHDGGDAVHDSEYDLHGADAAQQSTQHAEQHDGGVHETPLPPTATAAAQEVATALDSAAPPPVATTEPAPAAPTLPDGVFLCVCVCLGYFIVCWCGCQSSWIVIIPLSSLHTPCPPSHFYTHHHPLSFLHHKRPPSHFTHTVNSPAGSQPSQSISLASWDHHKPLVVNSQQGREKFPTCHMLYIHSLYTHPQMHYYCVHIIIHPPPSPPHISALSYTHTCTHAPTPIDQRPPHIPSSHTNTPTHLLSFSLSLSLSHTPHPTPPPPHTQPSLQQFSHGMT